MVPWVALGGRCIAGLVIRILWTLSRGDDDWDIRMPVKDSLCLVDTFYIASTELQEA